MSQLVPVDRLDSSRLPPLSPEIRRTFHHGQCRPALLLRDSVVFRYGSFIGQLTGTGGPWLFVTETLFAFSEDALRFCSLLDATLADIGERNTDGSIAGPGTVRKEAWNSAAWRGRLRAAGDLIVWSGLAAPMLFDRRSGGIADRRSSTGLYLTEGGADQILIRTEDVSSLRLVALAELPRVRLYH